MENPGNLEIRLTDGLFLLTMKAQTVSRKKKSASRWETIRMRCGENRVQKRNAAYRIFSQEKASLQGWSWLPRSL